MKPRTGDVMWRERSIRRRAILASALGAGALALTACGGGGGGSTGSSTTPSTAASPKFSHPTKITNAYLPISKFQRCTLAGDVEGSRVKVVRTLQQRTKTIKWRGGTVDALVQEDRETEDGALSEITFDYFAQSDAGDVYYLGEDVDTYENGKVTGHGGAWLLGRDTQTPGLLMPANPKLGSTFTSEDVPGITHEDDRVVSSRKRASVGGRSYPNVIRVREDTRPRPEVEYKLYSRGTGVITEENGALNLVGCR